MKQTTKVLLSAVLTIALCLSVISGATFALFTDEAKTNIAVTAGKVNVVATFEGLKTWSYDDGTDYATDKGRNDGTFTQGGKATVVDSTLTLDKIIPGDKAEITVVVTNNSNVNIQ